MRRKTCLAVMLCALGFCVHAGAASLNVGSKRFTESYILGEIIRQTAQAAGETTATHQQGLGNTAIVLNALRAGSIDLYPEYTGTIAKEILKLDAVPPLAELNAQLAPLGLAVGVPLGFNNTYALAMRADDARAKGITKLSDLKSHPELKLGLSQEFIGRADGWPGLKRIYDLPFDTPRGLDHGLAYEAIAQKQVDAIDIYSTDAKIDKVGLVVLADDKSYFPRYDAVLLYRADAPGDRDQYREERERRNGLHDARRAENPAFGRRTLGGEDAERDADDDARRERKEDEQQMLFGESPEVGAEEFAEQCRWPRARGGRKSRCRHALLRR